MKNSIRAELLTGQQDDAATAFCAPLERDGTAMVAATSRRVRTISGKGGPQGPRAELSGTRPLGAFEMREGRVRWHPAVDVTRVVTTAEVVVGAVLVAHRLAHRPSATKAKVTMGPGGWVSMKGGTVALRRASRPLGRPRPLTATPPEQRAPLWARVLSAVPLQSLMK